MLEPKRLREEMPKDPLYTSTFESSLCISFGGKEPHWMSDDATKPLCKRQPMRVQIPVAKANQMWVRVHVFKSTVLHR
jgi:hypothetical protein